MTDIATDFQNQINNFYNSNKTRWMDLN
jgi:hypothetical protein